MAGIVALFPGQGSQHVGMAKDLISNFRVAAQTFEEASDAISLDLKKLCLDGPESDLVLTENTQPSLLTASIAAFRATQEATGFKPAAVAGHSLGEYTALVAAGALPLATAVRWVRERGRAMQAAVPAGHGTMAAVLGMEDEVVTRLCAAATQAAAAKRASLPDDAPGAAVNCVVEPANFNAPGQIVIAGSVDAVQEAIAMIKAGGEFPGGKAIPLSVSAPFHCQLMRKARDRMAELFAQAKDSDRPQMPTFPYAPNRTARLTREAGVVFELLVEQVDHPVLWRQTITGLLEGGYTSMVECGPGKVLAGLNKRIAQTVGKECKTSNVSDATTLQAFEAILKGAPA